MPSLFRSSLSLRFYYASLSDPSFSLSLFLFIIHSIRFCIHRFLSFCHLCFPLCFLLARAAITLLSSFYPLLLHSLSGFSPSLSLLSLFFFPLLFPSFALQIFISLVHFHCFQSFLSFLSFPPPRFSLLPVPEALRFLRLSWLSSSFICLRPFHSSSIYVS